MKPLAPLSDTALTHCSVGSQLSADQVGPFSGAFPEPQLAANRLGHRFRQLQHKLGFVAESFAEFDDLVERYIRRVPLDACTSLLDDADRCLQSLAKRRMTAEQRDAVACQRARLTAERAALENRAAQARFEDMRQTAEHYAPEWGCDEDMRLHLNPARAWASLETGELLGDAIEGPVQLLFFVAGGEVRAALLDAAGRELVRHLEIWGPCRFDELMHHGDASAVYPLIEQCHELVEMGLAAFSTCAVAR